MELGLRLIFWELTRSCNLRCPYCRREDCNDKGLPLESALYIIDSISTDYKPLLVFSGGEPLLYPYIFEAASYARKKGLMTALATNGTLIDKAMAGRLKTANFHRVAISLDSASQESNDAIRGGGAFTKTMHAIQYLKSEGVAIQVNMTVLKKNLYEISDMYELCLRLGIEALHIFAFVPVGCGIDIPEEERPSGDEYEDFLNKVADLALEARLELKVTCAPHYQRILVQKCDRSSRGHFLDRRDIPVPSGGGVSTFAKASADKRKPRLSELLDTRNGCLAGTGVCFISGTGEVYPCGYLTLSAGNIFKEGFKTIWEKSSLFESLRNPGLVKGKCGICEYVDICGGCRARAFNATGDYLQEEPDCVYQPLTARSKNFI